MERINTALVHDTWIWVEYWKGNERVRAYIEGSKTRITSVITIVELERFYGQDRERMDQMIRTIRSRSLLVPVDLSIAGLRARCEGR